MIQNGYNYWNDYYWGGNPYYTRVGNPWGYGFGLSSPYYSDYPYEYDVYEWEMSDSDIREEVQDNLQESDLPRRDKKNIKVDVSDGVVTLSGDVGSRRCKWEAYSSAYWSDGVLDVINNISVKKASNGETKKTAKKK